MKAIAFLIAFFLGTGAAPGENRKAAPPTGSAQPRAMESDLDFSEDEKPAPSVAASAPEPSRRPWILWTAGAAALAGGMTWLFLREPDRDPGVTRKEQVFTDDR